MTRERLTDASRRRVLQTIGATGLAAAFAGTASAQETAETETDGEETETAAEMEETTHVILGGESSHWLGLAPKAIHGEENPTLALQAGEQYTVTWINLDGAEHELVVLDGGEEELEATDSNEEPGATASVTFEGSEEMAAYHCEYHPDEMQGDVSLGEGFEAMETEAETGTEDEETGMEDEETETTEC